MRRVLGVLVLLALVLSALIGFKVWEQRAVLGGPAQGSGVVEGTAVDLSARVAARVLEVKAPRGTQVGRGDLLLLLDCSDPQAILDEAEARLDAARDQARAAASQASAAAGARGAAAAQAQAAAAQAAAVAHQRDAAGRHADRLDALAEDVTPVSRDQTRTQAQAASEQARAAEAASEAGQQQERAATSQSQAAAAQADAAARAVAATEAAVERARMLVDECEVRAPRAGWVDQVMYEAGELAPMGMTLVRLVDLSEVKVTFYLPNAELAAAKPGGEAIVEADAWPGARWQGRVSTVSTSAEFTPRNIQTRSDRDRLVYPIEIVVPNPEAKLRPGMPVQVTLPGTDRG